MKFNLAQLAFVILFGACPMVPALAQSSPKRIVINNSNQYPIDWRNLAIFITDKNEKEVTVWGAKDGSFLLPQLQPSVFPVFIMYMIPSPSNNLASHIYCQTLTSSQSFEKFFSGDLAIALNYNDPRPTKDANALTTFSVFPNSGSFRDWLAQNIGTYQHLYGEIEILPPQNEGNSLGFSFETGAIVKRSTFFVFNPNLPINYTLRIFSANFQEDVRYKSFYDSNFTTRFQRFPNNFDIFLR